MRRRDFTTGLLLATAVGTVRAQETAKQHRIAIIAAGPVARIHDPGIRFFQQFFEELRRLGDVEGQNLTVDGYSGDGRPEGYAELAREVVSRNPDVIVASGNGIALAARAATGTIPIVWIAFDPIQAGLAASLAHPGGNSTGVTVDAGIEISGKRLQMLKEAVPSASKVALLDMRTSWESAEGQQNREELWKASRLLEISLIDMLVQEATPSEFRRVFAEIAPQRPEAIIVSGTGEFRHYRQLIVELVEKSRLPAMYGSRDYAEVGGLMAYEFDQGELGRRTADDVHQILNGAKPGDIPIYQPAKFEFLINLKAAKALGLNIPPTMLGRADEVIE
jgi:putative tryptophan/tyrosine transport system substrate-binding protein